MVETLIERLRNADTNSQQRVLGSRIFGEAADRLEALEREKEELRKELDHWKTEALGDRQKVERRDRQLAERDADLTRVLTLLQWAHDTLYEINLSNYDHDEVCKLNYASVEVILGIAPILGETHGKTPEWWQARAALAGSGDGWRPAKQWPEPGDEMEFLARNGYPAELERAMTTFTKGQILTVESCEVGGFDHRITFKDVKGRWNGVMFALRPASPSTAGER